MIVNYGAYAAKMSEASLKTVKERFSEPVIVQEQWPPARQELFTPRRSKAVPPSQRSPSRKGQNALTA